MGLPPPHYRKDSLLGEPIEKKTILPVQGGGARVQKGGADTVYKGLVNAGIDCYINSAIQFLYSVVPFRNLVLKSTADTLKPIATDKDEADTIRKRQGILALKHVFEEYEKVDKIDIRNLSDSVNAFDPILRLGGLNPKGEPLMNPFRQQDSHELIGNIIDSLKNFVTSEELKTFEHVYSRSVLCKDTNTRDLDKPRSSSIIILPMNGKSIQEMFINAQNARELDEKNNKIPLCVSTTDKEGIGISITDKYDVSKTEYLTFLLQRYTSDVKKINDSININKIIKIGERNYEIIGSILHMGETGSGHYIYNVYHEGSLAITLNDETKTESTDKSVGPFVEGDVSSLGYIFLYKYTDKKPESVVVTESTESQEPTIKLEVGFRVRNPETAKEAIKQLSFTPTEELLFKHLGFDTPFIRNYITLPEATKEKSEASKEAFFKFWKMYVLMDGTSQFSLMTKGESQKVQQYMRDILDAYRKYLSESALQLLFHTSGKPFTPVPEGPVDPFVFTKSAKPIDHTKISKAAKDLIEAVAAAKGLDFKSHRISIAKAKTLTTAKASYEGLKIDIAKLIEQGKKAIAAGIVASLDTGETLTAITAVEGFKFSSGEDLEDVIKAANDLISLATNLIKKLEALEKAAREFAIIVEVEVEDENDDSYTPSENGDDDEGSDEGSDEDSDDGLDDGLDNGSEGEDTNNSGSENTRPPPRPKNVELNVLKAIFNKKKDGEERILEAFNYLSETFPKPKYLYFKSLMGVGRGSHFDIDHPKIEPSSFFELYLEKKNDNELTFPWILNTLIRIKYKKFKSDELKPVFLDFFKDHIFNAPGGVKYKERVISYIEGK